VPKEYRDELRLAPGAPMTVLRVGDGLILMPEQARFRALCEAINSALESGGVTDADLQATLPEARRRKKRDGGEPGPAQMNMLEPGPCRVAL
jgi:bifunctional DNA-binding transcriptional regulator/antitoxin component of YhaV-PrlF toxin-antitoxin module